MSVAYRINSKLRKKLHKPFGILIKGSLSENKEKIDEILEIQISQLIEGGIKFREINHSYESLNNFYMALLKVNNISNEKLKMKFKSDLFSQIRTTQLNKSN